ncbi:MAG: sporulation transcription factor Spo0A [Firmicutes bacterium]|nr:sporulation transcription factor Spo0A [Bacillota bacterium]
MSQSLIRLVMVDDNVDLVKVVSEFISTQPDMSMCGVAYNGSQAIEVIRNVAPDVILLDLIMPHLDGLGVIEYLGSTKLVPHPRVLVITAISLETTAASVVAQGADYYMAKPFDLEVLAGRIRRLAALPPERPSESHLDTGSAIRASSGNSRYDVEASKALHKMGVPANLKGYLYLRAAIIMALEKEHEMGSMTYVVYPAIAKAHNTTPSRVERAMRHAIETAWNRGDINVINRVFGYTVDAEKGRPTNSAFITRIASKIKIDLATGKRH